MLRERRDSSASWEPYIAPYGTIRRIDARDSRRPKTALVVSVVRNSNSAHVTSIMARSRTSSGKQWLPRCGRRLEIRLDAPSWRRSCNAGTYWGSGAQRRQPGQASARKLKEPYGSIPAGGLELRMTV